MVDLAAPLLQKTVKQKKKEKVQHLCLLLHLYHSDLFQKTIFFLENEADTKRKTKLKDKALSFSELLDPTVPEVPIFGFTFM